MRALSRVLLLVLICFAGVSAPVLAQSLPPGTYLETCSKPRVDGGWGGNYRGTLRADCPDNRNRYRASSINADCDGDIANNNGQLQCVRYGNIGGGRLPQGSYRMSCYNGNVSGNTLTATCMDTYNNRRGSSISINSCRNRDIANSNGRLVCTNAAVRGSYQQTCDSAYMNGNILTARCADTNNYPRRSSINVDSCRNRNIANENGQLVCTRGNGNGGGVPAGSYQQTCTGAYMNGTTLTATCQDAYDGNRRTSLDTRTCNGRDIGNDNGNLRCDGYSSGGGNGAVLPGSYQQSCNSAYMRGNTLTATCPDANGRYKRSELNTASCRGRDIANRDGRLTCNT
jgi:CVNH domain